MKFVKRIFAMNTLLKGGCMKRYCFVFATILVSIAVCAFFFSGCVLVEPQAEVTIGVTSVGSYDVDDWYMDIPFTIENTGLYNIISYDITFTVVCTDETQVNDVYWGSYLYIDESYSDVLRVYTLSKVPSSAHVSNLVLESE